MRRLKMQLQCFSQVIEGFVFAYSLTSHINLEALRDIPLVFAPDTCGELPFDRVIVPYGVGSFRVERVRRVIPQLIYSCCVCAIRRTRLPQ